MHTPLPVQMQEIPGRLRRAINEHLMEDGTQDAFFEALRCPRMMPNRREVVAQTEQALALLVTQRDVCALERRQLRFDLDNPLKCVVPATLQLTGHSSIVGIDSVVLPPGVLNVIVRFFQGKFYRLPFGVVFGHQPIQGV